MVTVTEKDAAEKARAVKAGELPGPAATLAEAMARIYADGGRYVQKTGQMQGVARYSYAKEGDFIAAIRPLMETHGVTVRPVQMQVISNDVFQRKNGGDAYRVVVLATFEFLHSSGDKATAQAIGEGQDSGDKAFNKAMTGAFKYCLRQAFCVETGDDPDDTPSHEQERAPASRHHAAPPTATPPDNKQLRARIIQDVAMCHTHAEMQDLIGRVKVAADEGKLSPVDIETVKAAIKDWQAQHPKPAPAGAK